jgi:hypothetical protein
MSSIHKRAAGGMATAVFLSLPPPVDTLRPAFVISDAKIVRSKEANEWLPAKCKMVKEVYLHHAPCHQFFIKRHFVECQPLFSCCFLIVDIEAIICHL